MRSVFLALMCAWVSAFAASTQTNVQMVVPGFTVQELPVRLPNINNLRFAPDGRLFALGYNGKVYVLRDTNGDGLEDRAEPFWDKPTLNVPVGLLLAPEGVYVASHGKVSLLVDTNNDSRADIEKVLASGWPETDVKSGGVDAAGLAKDYQGNIYFGLLTADYSNPYRVKDGVSRYDVNGKRGTIQKLTPDGKLHTMATGIRVPYTLAFNRTGDLFMTDQEGETWCPNGNPLDELNHIVLGKNYGFPPRDPKYLPDLISEMPVVGFGPQHQSTCGMIFNEPTKGQGLFGPSWWEGDAFVAGQSRGKIWRVRLVKTPHGYIGREYLIACLDMLTLDLAISKRGELYVSCHSGPPDWGTGPNGAGKLFKITYTDTNAPQPVLTAITDDQHATVFFDRPLDMSATNVWIGAAAEFGGHVRAGDRFESFRPGYKVVQEQHRAIRKRARVAGAELTSDNRALRLRVIPPFEPTHAAFTLPAVRGPNSAPATLDLGSDASGVTVSYWNGSMFFPRQGSAWLPHLDTAAAFGMMRGSPSTNAVLEHGGFRLVDLRTVLNFPSGEYDVNVEADQPFTLEAMSYDQHLRTENHGRSARFVFSVSNDPPHLIVSFTNAVAGRLPNITCWYRTPNDSTLRAIPPGWLRVPDFRVAPSTNITATNAADAALGGGDFARGKALFFSEQLKCAPCHRVRGEGGEVGPDLSNLTHRDAVSVLRDIWEPGATVNPDFVAYNVVPKAGDALYGFIRAHGEDSVRVIAADGKETPVRRADIVEIQASSVSLMPEGLLAVATEQQVRDLLTFLLTAPAEKPKTDAKPTSAKPKTETPPKRTRAEVDRVLKSVETKSEIGRPLSLTLVASKQDHEPGEHDYPAWQTNWTTLLGAASNVAVRTAWQWPSDEQFRSSDVLIFYFWNHDWNSNRYAQLLKFFERGGGIVSLHAACIADNEPEGLAEYLGLAAQPKRSKYRHGPLDLKIVAPASEPITRGLKQLRLIDETYWPMIGDASKVHVLATAEEEGKPHCH